MNTESAKQYTDKCDVLCYYAASDTSYRGPATSIRITIARCVIAQNGVVFNCFTVEACNYEKNSTEREFHDGDFPVSDYVHTV